MKKCKKFSSFEFGRIERGLTRAEMASRKIEILAWEVVYAERKLAPLKAEYREIAARMYLAPDLNLFANLAEFWCGDLTRDTQFITFAAHNWVTHGTNPVYEYSEAGGWREIDESDWGNILRLERDICDAGEEYNEALWQARDITDEQWQSLRASGVVA